MFKILTKEWVCPWNLIETMEQITLELIHKQVIFQHMREGNQLADHLANAAIEKGKF